VRRKGLEDERVWWKILSLQRIDLGVNQTRLWGCVALTQILSPAGVSAGVASEGCLRVVRGLPRRGSLSSLEILMMMN
jgi:hypothetical protein